MNVATPGSEENTTHLALTPQERNELRLALRTDVTDLHMEIARTVRSEFRERLEARRAVLEKVLRRLGGATTATTGQRCQGEAE